MEQMGNYCHGLFNIEELWRDISGRKLLKSASIQQRMTRPKSGNGQVAGESELAGVVPDLFLSNLK